MYQFSNKSRELQSKLKAFMNDKKEGYSMGALTQLYAKGPQDTYLTGDAWKYIPPYYYNYGWGPYHMPTRHGKLNYYYYRPYGLLY